MGPVEVGDGGTGGELRWSGPRCVVGPQEIPPLSWSPCASLFVMGCVCVYFVPEHEDKDCLEQAVYSKQTGQKIGAFHRKPTAQYLSDNRSNCSVYSQPLDIIKNKMCSTYDVDFVCLKFNMFTFQTHFK